MGEEKNRQASNLQFIKKNAGSSQVMVYVILVVLLLAAQLMSPGYLKPTHVAGILRLASFMGIAAIGQNLTILTGGIDLSIANTITFANVIAAQIMMGRNENLPAALFAVIVMGVMVGFINGVGIHWLKIPPFIMTLGVGTVIQGVFLIYTKGAPKGNASPLLKAICGQSFIGILSGIVVIWAVMAAVTIVLLRNTPYGRKIYSVGTSYNTKTIAAVIIGGTAITGGKGGYIGTIAGAIIMTILDDFLTIVNIPEAGRQIMQGVIIVLLVLIYSREKHKK